MVEILAHRKQSRLYGALCTALIMGALFLFFKLFILRTPNPPYPENEGGGGTGTGIELNLGFTDIGSGATPAENSVPEEVIPEEPVVSDESNLATQDVEEAPVIQATKRITKKEKKEEVKKEIAKKEKPVEKTEPKKTVNTNALYKRNATSTDGTTNTAGDQGSPNGNIGAKAFGNGGSGGSGGGSGGGIGTGTGTGIGSGISYNLSGRSHMALPQPVYTGQVDGKVVVEVTVDKNGNVTGAIAGVKGSTTLENSLLEAAKQAAMKAKFNRKPDAPAYQKGSITYVFKLQ